MLLISITLLTASQASYREYQHTPDIHFTRRHSFHSQKTLNTLISLSLHFKPKLYYTTTYLNLSHTCRWLNIHSLHNILHVKNLSLQCKQLNTQLIKLRPETPFHLCHRPQHSCHQTPHTQVEAVVVQPSNAGKDTFIVTKND